MEIRAATEADLESINDLYNNYILTSPATFDIEPFSIERRREWFSHYSTTGRYRVFVACDEESVLGFASSSQFRPKAAYETSVETTVYCAESSGGRGIGSELYQALFAAIEDEDIHRAYAGITMPNAASVALHEKFGFKQVAYFTEQGRKFDRYWDVAWFEKEMT